ncbi:hypothetical protein HII17_04935 [Thalassotalea sp. M1531]|uniref:Uncharacterized protein n=1 Tax=Thalassotalea algicola TaxID=2716224 RepID=A0A7Y0Q6J2_9GAMM|nr:hypothetical protein [Thalassotalea algicola]NMP30902.1 hypothetical protein [Thalassotalea algicola]
MSDNLNRYIQIGDWCFELKMVRALKVDEYGKPYNAIANCNINGDSMYVDGLVTKSDEEFTKDDFMTFYKFTEMMGLDNFAYHRYHNGKSVTKEVKVRKPEPKVEQSIEEPAFIKLVK